MPRIPMLGQPSAPSSAVDLGATPNRRGAQAIAGSVEQLGRVIEGFGQNLLEKRTQAEISTYTSKADMDLTLESQQWEEKLKVDFAQDPKGYTQAYQEKLEDWKSTRLAQAPNEQAKGMLSRFMDKESASIVGKANAWEKQQVAQGYITEMAQTQNSSKMILQKKPDAGLGAQLLQKQFSMIDARLGVTHDLAGGEKMKMAAGTEILDSMVTGFMDNKLYGAGLSFLEGKDAAGKELLKYVDADKLGHAQARLKAGLEQQNQISKSILNKQVGDYKQALLLGRNVGDSERNKVRSMLSQLPEEERNYLNDDLVNAEKINQNLITLKSIGLPEAEAIVASGVRVVPQDDGSSFNLESRENAQAIFQKQAEAIILERKTDSVGFSLRNDKVMLGASKQATDINNPQAMRDYVTMLDAKNAADKIPTKRVLSAEMATAYKSMLMAKNADLAVKAEKNIREGYGEGEGGFSNTVMVDLARDEKFQPYAIAFSMDNPETKADLLNKIHNEEKINLAYKQTKYKDEDFKKAFLEPEYQQFMSAAALSDPASNNAWIRTGIGKAVELTIKEALAADADPKEARKMAIKKIIKDNFEVVQARNSSVIVPKKLRASDSVDNFIMSANQTSTYKTLGISTPKNYGENLTDGTTDLDQRYLLDIAKNNAWISNETQDGMYLMKKRDDGELEKVLNKEGKHVEVKFAQMAQVEMSSGSLQKREDRQAWREKDQQMKDYINNKTKRNF